MNSEAVEVYNIMAKKISERDLEILKLKSYLIVKTREIGWKQKQIEELSKSHHDENLNSLIVAIAGISCMIVSIHDTNWFYLVISIGLTLIGSCRIIESVKNGR